LSAATCEALGSASLALRRILKVRSEAGSSTAAPRHGEQVHLPGIVRAGPPVFSSVPERAETVGKHPAEFGLMEDASLSVQMLPDHSSRLMATPPPWAGRGIKSKSAAADLLPRGRRSSEDAGSEWVVAPMPGRVVEVKVKPGDAVRPGDHLLTLEAMKMQNHIAAPRQGNVGSVEVRAGERVSMGQRMVRISPKA